MTDDDIIAIRDEHLPSQGESFDCLAFARAVLAKATSRDPGKAWDRFNEQLAAARLREALAELYDVMKESMGTGGWVPSPLHASFMEAMFKAKDLLAESATTGKTE